MLGIGMFIVQDIFNMVVPSGSGQAAITMPIMAPLADLVGITRQTAVLAFQMGDAFTNSVTPASGTTMTIPQHCWHSPAPLVEICYPHAGHLVDCSLCGSLLCNGRSDRSLLIME